MRRDASAFTLIELLVVITIIVVLLSLLVPALDKAIYQAQLAVCGANLRGAASSVQTYAMAHKRHYPDRPAVRDSGAGWEPFTLTHGLLHTQWDDRIVLRQTMSLDQLNDPVNGDTDLDNSKDDSTTLASYDLWFGFQYHRDGVAEQGMFKVGNRLGWTSPNENNELVTHRFRLLISDRDHLKLGEESQASHPDIEGVMSEVTLQDAAGPWVPVVPLNITWSGYQAFTDQRGGIDHNYAYDDGSVARFDAVLPYDERVKQVPETNGNETPENVQQIPEN